MFLADLLTVRVVQGALSLGSDCFHLSELHFRSDASGLYRDLSSTLPRTRFTESSLWCQSHLGLQWRLVLPSHNGTSERGRTDIQQLRAEGQ